MSWYALKENGENWCYKKTILDIDSDEDCKNCVRCIFNCYVNDCENVSSKDDILQDLAIIAIEKHADPDLIYDPFKDLQASKDLLKLLANVLTESRSKTPSLIRVDFSKIEDMSTNSIDIDAFDKLQEQEIKVDLRKIKPLLIKYTRGKQKQIIEVYIALKIKYPNQKITYKQIATVCNQWYHFYPSAAQINMALNRIAEKVSKTLKLGKVDIA